MNSDALVKTLLGVLGAICFAMASWAVVTINEVSEQIRLLDYRVDQLQSDQEKDDKQDASIKRHWVLHGWAKTRINELRHADGMSSSDWPPDS